MVRNPLLLLLILPAVLPARSSEPVPSDADGTPPALSSVAGVDAMGARELVKSVAPELLAQWGHASPFLRIRELPAPREGTEVAVAAESAALEQLAAAGFRSVAIIEWSSGKWREGTRPGGGRRLGLDLREAFTRAHAYAEAYGARSELAASSHPRGAPGSKPAAPSSPVAFEFENETDISFLEDNPETYAAFLKACWLGVHDGEVGGERREADAGQTPRSSEMGNGSSGESGAARGEGQEAGKPMAGTPRGDRKWARGDRAAVSYEPNHSDSRLPEAGSLRVAMAPLALPPGPYFEQLVRNGFLSYTDCFNYHFYGYAEDFTGVYRQFEDAVATASRQVANGNPRASSSELQAPSFRLRPRTLPVILTEYGYGHLDRNQRNTVAGRVQQWAWFRDVARQIEDLRIAGPMAFYLPPYLEHGAFEFGLTMAAPEAELSTVSPKPSADSSKVPPPSSEPSAQSSPLQAPSLWTAGDLIFRPADFGASQAEPWMQGIGRKIGGNEATPALAWLLEEGWTHPYAPRDWTVTAPEPSPVVIDFLASPRLVQLKRYGGYLAADDPEHEQSFAAGELVLYNFSRRTIRGHLRAAEPGRIADRAALERAVELAPMARMLVPVRLMVPEARFERVDWDVRFVPDEAAVPPAIFATAFYPNTVRMEETVPSTEFAELPSRSKVNRAQALHRARAPAEPALHPASRWLVTDGVTLTENRPERSWRLTVPAFDGGARIATAELPLPDNFALTPGDVMRFRCRLLDPAGTDVATGKWLRVYFRTANGNLYGVWPWCRATADWTDYTEARENYTMMFYSRAHLPWRFTDNRVVSLVLTVSRESAPMTFEIRDARVVQLVRSAQ